MLLLFLPAKGRATLARFNAVRNNLPHPKDYSQSFDLGNDVHKITSNESNVLFGLLGVLIPVGTNVGFTCSPITIVGATRIPRGTRVQVRAYVLCVPRKFSPSART